MRTIKNKILYILCLAWSFCAGQTYFNNYYKTGYNNLASTNVLTTADSGHVFVNYIADSLTHRQDFGLMKIDKQGNEVLKKSFNMFNHQYNGFFQGMKQFIPATKCSYFLTGASYVGSSKQFVFINKLNRSTLDTLKTVIYKDILFNLSLSSFIKLSDNKYYLVGNKFDNVNQHPFILVLDSNLNITNTIDIYNPNNFGVTNAILNPSTKQLLLVGLTAIHSGNNQPITLMHVDTLGNPINAMAIQPAQFAYGLSQVYYSALDNSYVIVAGRQTSSSPGIGMSKLMISKLDATTLLPLWQNFYGDEALVNSLLDAVILNDGSIVACGEYSPLTSLPLMNEDCGGVIMKVDKNGVQQWFRQYNNLVTPNDPHNYWEIFYDIDATLEKGFILSGSVMN